MGNVMHRIAAGAALALFGLSGVALAQQAAAPPAYGPPITLEAAKKAAAAAEAEAAKNGWPVAIAIVDSAARLVHFQKLDDTQHGSVEIAIGKATTAVNLKRPTKALQDAIAGGGGALRLLAVPDIMPLEGGVPILRDGKIVGGVGVSGVASAQDAQVAQAGADAAK
jgi:uncharacterized protein GlcG (DUF336 family)